MTVVCDFFLYRRMEEEVMEYIPEVKIPELNQRQNFLRYMDKY